MPLIKVFVGVRQICLFQTRLRCPLCPFNPKKPFSVAHTPDLCPIINGPQANEEGPPLKKPKYLRAEVMAADRVMVIYAFSGLRILRLSVAFSFIEDCRSN